MSLETFIVLLLSLILFAAVAQAVRKGRPQSPKGGAGIGSLMIRAVAGSAHARYRLGMTYLEQSQDAAGFKWLLKSAHAGNRAAQDAVGMLYELGRGVSRDYGEAVKWYERSASQGFADSKVNLGNLYALGRGVGRNYGDALKWLEEAAAKGSRHAKNSLSWLLATCADGEIRNGRRAIGILSPVVNRGQRHPVLLDTLAAAYAEAGLFSEALTLVREGLSKMDPVAERDLWRQMEKRKRFYEEGRPWREPPEETTPGLQEPVVAGAEEWLAMVEAEKATGAPVEEDVSATGFSDEHGLALSKEAPAPEDGSPAGPGEGLKAGNAVSGTSAVVPGQKESADEGADTPAHVDYIVEKLLVIEQLLRPLKTEEDEVPEGAVKSGSTAVTNIHDRGGEDELGERERSAHEPDTGPRMARFFANGFVDLLLAERYSEVYRKMEKSFRAAVPEDQLGPMLEQMYDAYGGKPLDAELKAEDSGYRAHGGKQKYVHKFWYALRSTRFEKDAFALFVEILPDGNELVCSSFFVMPAKNSPLK
jgi:uncharacterized protein